MADFPRIVITLEPRPRRCHPRSATESFTAHAEPDRRMASMPDAVVGAWPDARPWYGFLADHAPGSIAGADLGGAMATATSTVHRTGRPERRHRLAALARAGGAGSSVRPSSAASRCALADIELGHEGQTGRHRLADMHDSPGAVCDIVLPGRDSLGETWLRVNPPIMFARNRTDDARRAAGRLASDRLGAERADRRLARRAPQRDDPRHGQRRARQLLQRPGLAGGVSRSPAPPTPSPSRCSGTTRHDSHRDRGSRDPRDRALLDPAPRRRDDARPDVVRLPRSTVGVSRGVEESRSRAVVSRESWFGPGLGDG